MISSEWYSILEKLRNKEGFEDICKDIENLISDTDTNGSYKPPEKRYDRPTTRPRKNNNGPVKYSPKFPGSQDSVSEVYIIKNITTGHIKIGKANDTGKRFEQLQRAYYPDILEIVHVTHVNSIGEAFAIERRAHRLLYNQNTPYHIKCDGYSEWYDVTEVEAINALS